MFVAQTLFTLLGLATSALATITITGPSPSDYWIQFTQNNITWTTDSSSDPTTANIVITNTNSSFLNGNFSIQNSVPLSTLSFTVTNVTLLVAPGFTVNFVNPANASQIYATSQEFEVKQLGTPPASVSATSASSTATSPSSGSSTGSSTGTSSTSGSSQTGTSNGALRTGDLPAAFPLLFSAVMILAGMIITI